MASEPRLFVITDIHDAPSADLCLSHGLPLHARLSLGELCVRVDLQGEALHHHLFHNGGMELAVQRLRALIVNAPPLIGLGYSAGGTALWKAVAQENAPLFGLMCVSSTRLRDEGALPIPNAVIFGENDPGRPSQEWMATVPQIATLLPDAEHAFYADGTYPALPDLRKSLARHVANWCS
ncbi:MAG: hypothetical protein JJ868_00540 [Shimia sp.]|uniref:hypothetical protein n=1 Tax=Shimia sp. TaxID=1954381 RepID=UPI001B23940D|nr:hypothetical protein [Shimia sp.]MBO6895834.1 hypothetical protein [Shimia sp.]